MTGSYIDHNTSAIQASSENYLEGKKSSVSCVNKECLQDLSSEKPIWLDTLLASPCVSMATKLAYSWSPSDHSANIFVKKEDPLTLHRQPVAKSTDACRGRRGVSRGLHVWKVTWSNTERGTDAVVGVATDKAPLHCEGYHSLVGGNNDQSWGWNIVRLCAVHNSRKRRYPSCPHDGNSKFPTLWSQSDIPDVLFMVLDMDEGTLSFVANNRFLGYAFTGLHGRTLFPIISSVWGHSEVTLTYINGLECKLSACCVIS